MKMGGVEILDYAWPLLLKPKHMSSLRLFAMTNYELSAAMEVME
jgi:hypothetical protein